MTLQELQVYVKGATAETWHQHPNGLGWVNKTAVVRPNAFIAESAIIDQSALIDNGVKIGNGARVGNGVRIGVCARVSDGAQIGINTQIGDFAQVHAGARIDGWARIAYNAKIGDDAQIGYYAQVHAGAQIGNGALVGDNVRIGVDAKIGDNSIWLKTPLYICGTKDILCAYTQEKIAIGCEIETIAEWLSCYQSMGKRYSYSNSQIEEYREYIRLFAKRYQPQLLNSPENNKIEIPLLDGQVKEVAEVADFNIVCDERK